MVWSGLVWSGLVWSGLVWSGLAWSGLVWSGLVWSGLVWSGLVLSRLVSSCDILPCLVVSCLVLSCLVREDIPVLSDRDKNRKIVERVFQSFDKEKKGNVDFREFLLGERASILNLFFFFFGGRDMQFRSRDMQFRSCFSSFCTWCRLINPCWWGY